MLRTLFAEGWSGLPRAPGADPESTPDGDPHGEPRGAEYAADVELAEGERAASLLACWSGWVDLRGAGRNRQIPDAPGLYRIRRAGAGPGLEYMGQTGRSLRGRLSQLAGVYAAQMPYRDPHTAGPALWALRDRDGCDFQTSVIETSGTAPQRKALEGDRYHAVPDSGREIASRQLRAHARWLSDLDWQQRRLGRTWPASPRRPRPRRSDRRRQCMRGGSARCGP
jgi:hypothetical protein